jgi:chromosome segregation ATPase
MTKKINSRSKKVEKIFSGTEVGVLIEHFESRLDAVIEGQKIFEEKIENRFDSLENRFDSLENRFDSLENRFDSLEKRFNNFEADTKANFKTVFKYLSRIDDEISDIKVRLEKIEENTTNKKEINFLKVRMEKLEKEFSRYKAAAQLKA